MSVIEKINGKTKRCQRRRFEQRPQEFIRDGEMIRSRLLTLSQQLARRKTFTMQQKEAKP